MAVLDCCPICLEEVQDGIICWHCDHLVHHRCIRGGGPIPCPICRSPWAVYTCPAPRAPDRTSVIETLAWATRQITRHRVAPGHRVAPYTPTPQASRPPRPVAAAQDIMFLCCGVDHRPEGAERAMLYTTRWDSARNRWLESWHCNMCDLTVGRRDVPPFPHWHIFGCPNHGRHTVVVDAWLRPLRIVGQACTRDHNGLYRVVNECSGGFDNRDDQGWIPRFRQLQGTSLPHWLLVDDDSLPELTEYQRVHAEPVSYTHLTLPTICSV